MWRCRDWWSLYTLGLEFVTGLVNCSGDIGEDSGGESAPICPAQITPIILFLGSHEDQLVQVATLLRHTADPLATDLVHSLVALISALTVRQTLWDSIQPSVRDSLMVSCKKKISRCHRYLYLWSKNIYLSLQKCMYLVYDSTVNLLLRPRILKFIIDGVSVESAEELQSCDDKLLSTELRLLVNKLIIVNWWCAQCFVRFSPRLNALVDTIYTQDFWYTPLAEMNFGPPQMCINSAPHLTYGTIISSTQLFSQALYSRLSTSGQAGTSATSTNITGVFTRRSTRRDNLDSAKREWERATPENPRKIHVKDLRRILQVGRPSTSSLEFSSYVTGHDITVPLLGNPHLLRRPYDPLICENTILSRVTPLGHHSSGRHVSKNNGQGQNTPGQSDQSTTMTSIGLTPGRNDRPETDPWFASMNENNAMMALEVNLVLVLCQTLEGVKSPRLALRDRQLIARETANEIGVFFDFLEQRADMLDESTTEGALVGSGFQVNANDTVRNVKAPEMNGCPSQLMARLCRESTITKVPISPLRHDPDDVHKSSAARETRLDEDIVTTGALVASDSTNIRFLQLLGKLLKSMLESLDSVQYS